MSTPLRERLRANLRLTLLRFLDESGGYTLNASTLTAALRDIGLVTPRGDVDAELEWLAEAGLVRLERPMEDVLVAAITTRGLEAAQGVARVEGVTRPAPRG